MADPTFEAEELARIMAQVNKELRDFGEVTEYTRRRLVDAEMKAEHGIENFSAGMDKGEEAVKALGAAATAAGKAMLDGKKGAAAFNDSLDSMSTAVVAAVGVLGLFYTALIPLTFVIGAVTKGLVSYTKAANEMADKQYKAYSQLAKSGLAAGDGMSGVFRDAKQLGFSMNELDSMISIMADRSEDLAMLGGTATQGAKMLADMGEGLRDSRQEFLALGMGAADVTEGLGRYTATMTRAGRAQNMTQAELTAGAKAYILEQDRLAKLTGMSAQKQQDILDRARENEQFNAKIRQLELQNTAESKKAAEGLRIGLVLAAEAGEGIASGFMGAVNKNLANPDTQKLMRSSYSQIMSSVEEILQGGDPIEAMQKTFGALGRFEKDMGIQINQLGAGADNFIKSLEVANAANLALQDRVTLSKKIQEEQDRIRAGQGDKRTAEMARTIKKQMDANEAMEQFIDDGILPATKAMGGLTDAINFLLDITGFGIKSKQVKEKEQVTGVAEEQLDKALEGATIMQKMGFGRTEEQQKAYDAYRKAEQELINQKAEDRRKNRASVGSEDTTVDMSDIPSAAAGGFLKGPKSGYFARLHGNELVIPEDMLQGGLGSVDSVSGLVAEEQERINSFVKEILKDTETLAKLTDTDAKRTQEYSRTQKKLIELKVKLMEEEIDVLEEQNKAIEEMANVYERAGGSGGAASFKKMMRMQSLGMGGAQAPNQVMSGTGMGGAQAPNQVMSGTGIGVKSGTGLPVTTRPGGGAPEEYGISKMTKTKLEDVLAFGDRSGSRANFEALDDSLQNAVMRAAQEYQSVTGQKIKINSAARDPADQERIYAESVEAGRPGIGPTGMPMAKPGTSKHERGMAVDIQNYADSRAIAAFNRQGLFQKVPSDPVHFTFEDGGVASGPRSGYGATLHGDEAVIPLNNRAGNFVKMFESMAESNRVMVSMMQEMVTAQKNSVGVQEKMLRMAS